MRTWSFSVVSALVFSLAARDGAAQRACGNGRVDAGELCDPSVQWSDRCPSPWGLCWTCAPACNGRVLSSSDDFVGLVIVPYCTEQTASARNVQRYDARGHLIAYEHLGTIHWSFEYDALGRMLVQHMRVDPWPAEHLFRAWTDDRITRAWLDDNLDGTPERTWNFEYTPEHRLDRVWMTPVENRPSELDRRYTYDRAGRVIVDETRFGDASWHNTDVFAYDAAGREVYSRHAGEPRNCDSECRTRWDALGSTRRCEVGAPDAAVTTLRVTRSDRHGHARWMLSREATGARVLQRFEALHDVHGNVVAEVEYDPRGQVVRRTRTAYDRATGLPSREDWDAGDPQRTVSFTRDFSCLATILPTVPWREHRQPEPRSPPAVHP